MSDPHLGFITASYALTFVVVGAMAVSIAWRHRTLQRALRDLGDTGPGDARERGREHA